MELVDKDYSIKYVCFKCLESNKVYTVMGTNYGEKGIKNAIDTIVREDGERRKFAREMMKKRFKNIEPISLFYESNKRNKKKL